MAAILSNRSDPRIGFFSIYIVRRTMRIKINPEGKVFDMPLTNVYRMRDVVRVIEYHAKCMNLSIVSENLVIDLTSLLLPEIFLPKFDYDLRSWPDFRDRFVELVIRNKHINSDITRFYYLLGCLQADAGEVLKEISGRRIEA